MFGYGKIGDIENILKRQLADLYGDEIPIRKLTAVLCYGSEESVVVAISDGCLALPIYRIGSVKDRVVNASELAAYIADQYAKSCEEKTIANGGGAK